MNPRCMNRPVPAAKWMPALFAVIGIALLTGFAIVLMPLMLNYNVNPDFNVNVRLGFYAPTGNYEVGRLANTGKNFWTIEPVLGLMYFGQKNGIEASAFVGADFNTENEDTNYKSGSSSTSTERWHSTSPGWAASREVACPRTTTSR